MKNKLKNAVRPVFVALFLFFITHNHLYAQTLWGKLYENNYSKKEAKGTYILSTDEFIVTGSSQNSICNTLAYLLATNQNGNVTWQTYLGDSLHNFYGTSVKVTNNGNYIVVGKTDKDQTYSGAHNDTCGLYKPYYNAFIAYVNPDSLWANWYYIFGDQNLNDEATEVIQDKYGDFIVTGSAWGTFSSDSCIYDSSDFVCTYGSDQSGILLSKFDINGNVIFNKVFYDYKYDNGVSLINDINTNQYLILFNRRDSVQTQLIHPSILATDYWGIFHSAMAYDSNSYFERIGQELVFFQNELVVIGNETDSSRNLTTSFLFNIDAGLNINAYSRIIHPYKNFLVKDVLEDIDTLVISGDAWQIDTPIYLKSKFLIKVAKNAGNFELSGLPPGGNITHYISNRDEDNTNFCIFPYTDSAGWINNGYHLFGNSLNYYFDHVKTNKFTISKCWQTDSIGLYDSNLTNYQIALWDYPLNTYGYLDTIASSIYEYLNCDGSGLRKSIQNISNSISPKPSIGLNIYPNPANESLTCEIKETGNAVIKIYSSTGSLIYSNTKELNSGKLNVNISDLSKGIYWININTPNNHYSARFMKE